HGFSAPPVRLGTRPLTLGDDHHLSLIDISINDMFHDNRYDVNGSSGGSSVCPRRSQSISRRPENARPRVTSSAYSRSPPTGRPEASLVTVTASDPRRRTRQVAVAAPSRLGSVAITASLTSPFCRRVMSSLMRRLSGPTPAIGSIAPPRTW